MHTRKPEAAADCLDDDEPMLPLVLQEGVEGSLKASIRHAERNRSMPSSMREIVQPKELIQAPQPFITVTSSGQEVKEHLPQYALAGLSVGAQRLFFALLERSARAGWESKEMEVTRGELRLGTGHESNDKLDGYIDELYNHTIHVWWPTYNGTPVLRQARLFQDVGREKGVKGTYNERSRITFRWGDRVMKILQVSQSYAVVPGAVADCLKSEHSYALAALGYLVYRLKAPQARTWEQTPDGLRHFLGLTGKYKNAADFRSKVIEVAVAEINEVADFTVVFNSDKRGRNSVYKFEFVRKTGKTLLAAQERRRKLAEQVPNVRPVRITELRARRGGLKAAVDLFEAGKTDFDKAGEKFAPLAPTRPVTIQPQRTFPQTGALDEELDEIFIYVAKRRAPAFDPNVLAASFVDTPEARLRGQDVLHAWDNYCSMMQAVASPDSEQQWSNGMYELDDSLEDLDRDLEDREHVESDELEH